MSSTTTVTPTLNEPAPPVGLGFAGTALRRGIVTIIALAAVSALFRFVLYPLFKSASVEENLTLILSDLCLLLLPYAAYIATGSAARSIVRRNPLMAIIGTLVATAVIFALVTAGQMALGMGAFAPVRSLQMGLSQTADGILVESVEASGAAEIAGIQVGDVITGIRRDPIDLDGLRRAIGSSNVDDPLRLRFVRAGEEQQLTVRVALDSEAEITGLGDELLIALVVAVVAIIWPGQWTPYVLILLSLLPLAAGYLWLILATFSYRTEGLIPLGGFTLDNWRFLTQPMESVQSIWVITLNTLLIAVLMTVLVVTVSAMAGYALARMNFKGRKTFLSMTLILHGFPAVTLLISIFFVLNFISKIPGIGSFFGYNTPGGIALVMVSFELPLGIWLMKGFFDNISWDMERSALIDGASRWRTFWEIILPQIRPGILALGIFAFISGWNAYLIPRTYSIGTNTSTLSVFMNQFIADTAPVNWNEIAAVGLFQLIPVFVFFVFAQEYLLNIYAGGLKGSN
jgi:inositol-phosphate transport system permease protein